LASSTPRSSLRDSFGCALREVSLPGSVVAQAGFALVACNAVYIPNLSTFSFDAATLVALLPTLVGVALLLLRT
jgi:hypothetical protein